MTATTIPIPRRMRGLPVDRRGYIVPRFVAWIDGQPDFRVVEPAHMVDCVKRRLCWLCGQPLGRWLAFVIGPMCVVNLVSSEPPSHHECAEYACKVCPFLTMPRMHRVEHTLPAGVRPPAGVGLKRNPGVAVLWSTRTYQRFRVDNGVLFQIGPAHRVQWFAEGREATHDEVVASIRSGVPALVDVARDQSKEALAALAKQLHQAVRYTPAGTLPADVLALAT